MSGFHLPRPCDFLAATAATRNAHLIGIGWLEKDGGKCSNSSPEPQKNPSYFPWYWLFYRDYSIMVYYNYYNYYNPHITGQYNPLYALNNLGSFHSSPEVEQCSRVWYPTLGRHSGVSHFHWKAGWVGWEWLMLTMMTAMLSIEKENPSFILSRNAYNIKRNLEHKIIWIYINATTNGPKPS